MTDNEIIKALECCSKSNTNEEYCAGCPYRTIKYCASHISKDTLSLINRQKAYIERFYDIGKMYSEVRAEAIREFAERLKAKEAIHFCKCGQPFVYTDLFNGEIDSLVEEMVGDSK